jgi:hypothetical protein
MPTFSCFGFDAPLFVSHTATTLTVSATVSTSADHVRCVAADVDEALSAGQVLNGQNSQNDDLAASGRAPAAQTGGSTYNFQFTGLTSGSGYDIWCARDATVFHVLSEMTRQCVGPVVDCSDPAPLLSFCTADSNTFTCDRCSVIDMSEVGGLLSSCGPGVTAIASGSSCTTACAAGYTPSSGSVACTATVMDAFTCDPDSCDASAAPTEGTVGDCTSSLASGSSCQPTCTTTGFTVSGTTDCLNGALTTTATCEPDACPVVGMSGTAGGLVSSCGTGVTEIVSGQSCGTACASDYTASAASVSCVAGTMAAFTCDRCDVPSSGIANGAPTGYCGPDTPFIATASVCTTACEAGYTPSVSTVTCAASEPITFTCDPDACTVPSYVYRGALTGVCGSGVTEIASGSDCTPACQVGWGCKCVRE